MLNNKRKKISLKYSNHKHCYWNQNDNHERKEIFEKKSIILVDEIFEKTKIGTKGRNQKNNRKSLIEIKFRVLRIHFFE